jgi:hypothetical protein
MKLQEMIAQSMSACTDGEKKLMAEFLTDLFTRHPCHCVHLKDDADFGTEYYAGEYRIKVPEVKLESAKQWLLAEGFTLRKRYSPGGTFFGYDVFLCDEYAHR